MHDSLLSDQAAERCSSAAGVVQIRWTLPFLDRDGPPQKGEVMEIWANRKE